VKLATRLFALSICFAGLSFSALANEWTEYRPEGAGFSIEMPGEWTVTVHEMKGADGDLLKIP
jgi:hypothetical protein